MRKRKSISLVWVLSVQTDNLQWDPTIYARYVGLEWLLFVTGHHHLSKDEVTTMITPHVAHPPPSAQPDLAGNRCRSSRIFFTISIQELFSTYISNFIAKFEREVGFGERWVSVTHCLWRTFVTFNISPTTTGFPTPFSQFCP